MLNIIHKCNNKLAVLISNLYAMVETVDTLLCGCCFVRERHVNCGKQLFTYYDCLKISYRLFRRSEEKKLNGTHKYLYLSMIVSRFDGLPRCLSAAFNNS